MDVELPDGTVVTDVPEGITQAQLMARMQKMNAPKPQSFGDRLLSDLRGISKINPVGIATTGMGMAQEGLGKVGKIAGGATTDLLAGHVPPEVAGIAGAAAEIAVPAIAGGVVGKAVGQPLLEAGGKRLMQSAIKPSSDDLIARLGEQSNAAKAIQTMLDENLNVTPAGAAALKTKITELHKEVAKQIANSSKTVDKAYVASEVNKVLTKFRTQVANKADTDAILKTWGEFNARFGNKIPVQEAFAMKQGTQQILNNKFGEMGSAATEAEKAMARGLRLGVEDAHPEIVPAMRKQQEFLNALDMMEKRAALEGNKNPIPGLMTLHTTPEAAAAYLVNQSAPVKSAIARWLYKSAGTASGGAGVAAGAVGGQAAANVRENKKEK